MIPEWVKKKERQMKSRARLKNETIIGFNVDEHIRNYILKLGGDCKITQEYLELVISLLESKKRRKLVDFIYSNTKAKKEETEYNDCLDSLSDGSDVARNVMRDINRSRIRIEKKGLDALLIKIFKKEKNSSSNSFKKELTELKNIFQLCEEDIKVLCFQYCYEVNSCFESFCDEYSFPEYLRLISVVEDISLNQLKKTLSKKEKLSMAGLAEVSDTKRPGYIDLDDGIQEYLGGVADVPLAEKYWKEIKKSNFSLDTFNVPEQGKNIIKALLEAEDGCNILLYGDEGTGKTEFVKSICKACGKKTFFVQHGEDGDVTDRKKALIASAGTVSLKEAVLVFDEADSFLNNEFMFFTSRKTIEKGWLNSFLDENNAKIIWITNNVSSMERSIKRRFSYSWNFKRFTKKELKNVWLEHLKKSPLKKHITAEMINEFSLQFRVNAAGIASALETVEKTINPNKAKKQEVQTVIKSLLTRHLELSGHKIKKPLNALTERYDISALNIDADTDVMLGSLKQFAKRGMKEEPEGENINLLLWGRPGTGKTEFAKYVSSATGMDLVVKRGSDLLSPWVGMTEQYIAEAFDEAQRQKAILFIDEADSFFTARESANRSWEVTQTNELLTQMENFNGILICCTNFLENLDKAAMRRFNWKVEFKSLKKEAKLTLYNKYFDIPDRLSKARKQKVMGIPDLTPGDLKSVWQKYRFADKTDLSHDEIISVLEKEVRYKQPKKAVNIGF